MAKILLIDDDAPVNAALCRLLQSAGHVAASALTGSIGLAMIAADKPDLVVLDQVMSGMSGIQVLKALRDGPHTASLPVIFYTATPDPAFSERAMLAGANGACYKVSIDPEQLLKQIDQILDEHAGS